MNGGMLMNKRKMRPSLVILLLGIIIGLLLSQAKQGGNSCREEDEDGD
jgi:hypothetical protein